MALKVINTILSKATKPIVAQKLSPFGELLEYEIDLKEKIILFAIHLKGELYPLQGSIKLLDFDLLEENGKLVLIVRKVSLNAREWMVVALTRYWPGELIINVSDNEYVFKSLKAAGIIN